MNLGGILDTARSVRDGYKAVGTLIKDFGQLDNVVRDLVKGNSLIASLEGREEVVSAATKVFTAGGPSSGGVSAGAGLGLSYSTAEESSRYIQNITTNVRAGRDITFESKDFETYGGLIRAENDLSIEAKTVSINASKDSYDIKGSSRGLSLGKTTHGSEGYSVGLNTGKTDGEGTLYNNSRIQAGNHLTVKAEITSIRGGRLAGRHTDVETGSLTVESLQDKENMNRVGVNVNYSLQTGTTKDKDGRDVSDNRSSVSSGVSLGNLDKLWVTEQSGIIGEESINVDVRDKTTLIGGIIANITRDGEDGGNLTFITGDLESRDLDSYDNSRSVNVNVNINQRSRNDNTELVLDRARNKDPNRKDDVREVPNRVDEKYSVGISGHETDKLTRATVGQGTLTITSGSISEEINRDISEADRLTRTSGIKETDFGFDSNPNSYGDLNEIISSDMGVIGHGIDDVIDALNKEKGRPNYEGLLRDGTFGFIRDYIEKPLAYINARASIFPTSIQNGGIVEQMSRMFRKDKNPIIEITYYKDEKGKIKVEAKEVERLSDIEVEEGNLRIYGNGISEDIGKATANAIMKTQDREYSERYNNGEKITIAMIYNPSRGSVADFIECIAGKIFDGSGSSFGISTGISQGQALSLATRDRSQNYDLVTYSQNNIIFLGTMNMYANMGLDMRGINARSIGSPIASTEYYRALDKVDGNFIGMAINKGDNFGDNGMLYGLSGERNGLTEGDIDSVGKRSAWQIFASNIPIFKAILRTETGNLMTGLPTVMPEESSPAFTKDRKGKPAPWENPDNIVIDSNNLSKIGKKIKPYLGKKKNPTDEDIRIALTEKNEILDNIHRGYVYTSAKYSEEKDRLIERYNNGNPDNLTYVELESKLREYDKKFQEDYAYLLINGLAAWEKSDFIKNGIDEYVKADMIRDYENGKYRGIEMSEYLSVNPYSRNGKSEVTDIGYYINRLRREVDVR